MRLIVTGGAGYIGSHTVRLLACLGHEVTVVDDLRSGHREALLGVDLVELDVRREEAILRLLEEQRADALLHFAASCSVAESVTRPLEYWENNVAGTLSLARAAAATGVRAFVLSSTAATYGEPEAMPIVEETPRRPVNPYGRSKAAAEDLLADVGAASGFTPVFLRYFNAAGADPEGLLGEDHEPETHLIPNAIDAALGSGGPLQIFGTDYPTADGTCVRDYVHVSDLAQAHVLALEWALENGEARAFNLGNGRGFSVREVVEAVRRTTGRDLPVVEAPRRAGDPPVLVAGSERARRELGWRPRYDALETIVETAWRWRVAHPGGYAA